MGAKSPEMPIGKASDVGEVVTDVGESAVSNRRGMAITHKALLGAGKGVIGAAKLTKNVLSPPVRLVGRNIWGAKWGIATAVGALGVGVGVAKPGETKDFTKELVTTNPTVTAREAAPVVKDALLDAVDTAISKAQKVDLNQRVSIEPISGDGMIKTEFGVITPEQKSLIDIAISNEKKNLDLSMTPEDWANVFKYEGLVKDIAEEHGIDGNDLLEIVVLESHGDPHAESPVGAAGLTQEKPEFAEKFGLKVVKDDDPSIQGMTPDEIKEFRMANDERYKPERNLEAAAQSIADNILKFKDKRIAYQVHHAGDRLIWEAVGDFVYKKYGYKLPYPIDVDIGSDDANYNEAIRRLGENQDAIMGKNPFAGGNEKPIGIVDLYSTGLLDSDGGDRYAYLMSGAGKLIVEKRAALAQVTPN